MPIHANLIGHNDISATETATLRHLKLTPDGTSLITASVTPSHTSVLAITVLPPDLLSPPHPSLISPFSETTLPEPVRALTPYPFYDLSSPASTLSLLSLPNHPLRLVNSLAPASPTAVYTWLNPYTEAYICPHSLMFSPDGEYFVAGADSQLGVFNSHRQGGPVETFQYKKYLPFGSTDQWGPGKGIVSSLDISKDGLLAAGTFLRTIGVYEGYGRGDCVTVIGLKDTELQGKGVSQVKWSDCGRYLVVAERGSDDILVFDIRGEQKLLQTFKGRNADSMMPLQFDVSNDILLAGGLDGKIRIWHGLGMTEGNVKAEGEWEAHSGMFVESL
jgi:WD40 repeat protein